MQQKSWWQGFVDTSKVNKDERTKYIRALAARNAYLTFGPMALLAGLHDWMTRGDTLGIWVVVSLISSSLLLFGLMSAPVLTVKTIDERANQVLLRNFSWAFLLMSIGVLCYLTYVTFLLISTGGSRSNQTWALLFQVSMVVTTATYVVKEREDNGQWSALYWLLAAINMFVAAMSVIFGLVEVVKDASFSKLMALVVNPNLAALIIISVASVKVLRYYNWQEAHFNE